MQSSQSFALFEPNTSLNFPLTQFIQPSDVFKPKTALYLPKSQSKHLSILSPQYYYTFH